jgi:Glycosyl hydrolase family 79 C-terminal beta domain
VTCGGRRGVSDTFATALWAPDTLFELMRAGVNGVNMHVRANPVNAPFALSSHGLYARPLLYGLIMFTRTLGPGAQLMSLGLHAKSALDLKAWAVRVRGGALHVLLIDKGARAVSVDLRLPASGAATVERLLAPSVRSTSGVTLAGQHLAANGAWSGVRRVETLAPGPGGYRVTVPGTSAALVSVHLRSGAPAPSRALVVAAAARRASRRAVRPRSLQRPRHAARPASRGRRTGAARR